VMLTPPCSKFQSSPGVVAGCDTATPIFVAPKVTFQSSPGVVAGCDP